jgi:lysophospholipase L1-like esterase
VHSGQATHLYERASAVPDPVLGYGPDLSGKMRLAARRVQHDQTIYDVLYSRDEEGRRITPKRGKNADTAILLFGCSFTEGAGLNDQECFAWQLGHMLGEQFQVYNYGFSGYGSHQMLALVESGRLDALVQRYTQIYAFFLTMADHPLRCLGKRPFSREPRYILENGALTYAGSFSHTVDSLFAHSQLYEQLKLACLQWLMYDYGLATHIAIVAKSMHELQARYNAHALTVIYPDFTRIEPLLLGSGVRTLSLMPAMPDYASTSEKYTIKGDGHPNALANTRIAEALFDYIQKHPHPEGQ